MHLTIEGIVRQEVGVANTSNFYPLTPQDKFFNPEKVSMAFVNAYVLSSLSCIERSIIFFLPRWRKLAFLVIDQDKRL